MNETKLRSDLYTSSVGLSQKHISYPNTHVFACFLTLVAIDIMSLIY